jgi:dynein heavy chain
MCSDKFGSQPTLELLRSVLDHGGWYDHRDKSFHTIQDVALVAAMGPAGSGSGRPPLSDRFLRHWYTVSVTPMDEATVTSIYSAIMKWHFDGKTFAPDVTALVDEVVGATRDMYMNVSSNLLPLPGKSHYMFSIRDVSRVIQVCLLVSALGGLVFDHSHARLLWFVRVCVCRVPSTLRTRSV